MSLHSENNSNNKNSTSYSEKRQQSHSKNYYRELKAKIDQNRMTLHLDGTALNSYNSKLHSMEQGF